MFSFFKKPPPKGTTITLKIDGMHCTSCSLNIDDSLEDLPGVIKSQTSYAHSQTVVEYNPHQISPTKLDKTIQDLGYRIRR